MVHPGIEHFKVLRLEKLQIDEISVPKSPDQARAKASNPGPGSHHQTVCLVKALKPKFAEFNKSGAGEPRNLHCTAGLRQ
jgi:hypothetical protein